MKELRELIEYTAAENAVKHNGKAIVGAVLGGVIIRKPELKKDVNKIKEKVTEIVVEINKLAVSEQEEIIKRLEDKYKLEKKERPLLKPLPNAKEGKVVMRFEPSPSGPLHIGHAYVLGLNYEYVKHYKGKIILRISDTNPLNIAPESYDMIIEDAKWLCENNISEIFIQSSRLDDYYRHVLRLIEEKNAYVCTCDEDDFKRLRLEKLECPCRNLEVKEQLKRWKMLFNSEDGYKEGEAVVRFKTDMKHKNPAMRDFPLLRICDESHIKTQNKYRVWPLMNFSVAVDDMDEGVTHTLRGKDHADNAKKQALLHEKMGFKTPEAINLGRINFKGFEVSCSKTRKKIEEGLYEDWADPRLPFLSALRRRGYQPEVFRRYAIEVGISPNDKTVEIDEFFKIINAFNKEIIDEKSNRYFFVRDPVKIKIEGINEERSVELDLHPTKRRGGREFIINKEFFISKEDYDDIKEGEIIRLIEAVTFKKEKGRFYFVSFDIETKKPDKLIHWLTADEDIAELEEIEVLMPNNTYIKGLGEKGLINVEEGEIVQFERFGFCRFEKEEGEILKFIFLHK